MTITQLYHTFDALLPTELSDSWDNDGLMLSPHPEKEIKHAAIALDCTPALLPELYHMASEGHPVDVIITHHPLIFTPLKSIVNPFLIELIQMGIAVMSFHTRLDRAEGGVSDCLAKKINLKNIRPFGDGAGRIGEIEPCLPRDFACHVQRQLEAPHIALSSENGIIRTVAVVGGAGDDYAEAALAAGADILVTGEAHYHRMITGGSPLNLITAGHYHTEFPVTARLTEIVSDADPEITITLLNSYSLQDIHA